MAGTTAATSISKMINIYSRTFTGPSPPVLSECMIAHARLMSDSYTKLTGRDLIPNSKILSDAELSVRLKELPDVVLLSHGVQNDPIMNYGNDAALAQFETNWEEITSMHSKYSAEAGNREEREEFIKRVESCGFADNYQGVRMSAKGNRFNINASLWNLTTSDGTRTGQAAVFRRASYIKT
eukprot:CFRG0486T1